MTGNGKPELVRIEDLANVKLSEKRKNTVQSFTNSNEIPVLDSKTKPVKIYSKLIDKRAQFRPPFLAAADEPIVTIKEKTFTPTKQPEKTAFKQEAANNLKPIEKQITNGHMGSRINSFNSDQPSLPRLNTDTPRSLTYEPAGPYTTRANFQGPLFQPMVQGQNFAPVWSQNVQSFQPQYQFQQQPLFYQQPQAYYQQPQVYYQQPITYQVPFVGQNFFATHLPPFYPTFTQG